MKSNKLKREPKYIAKFKAFPYQQEAVDAVKDLEYAAIFHEQGLGKTKIAIDVLLYWLSECSMDTALIVTKKQLVANWVNEFKDHTSIKPAVLNTDKNNNYRIFCGPYRVVLTNFETLETEKQQFELYREYVQNAADSIDEALEQGILKKGEEKISITVSESERIIKISDNGTGVGANDIYSNLIDIGNSKKRHSNSRGFRGIGRLSGLGYCQKLKFLTSIHGEEKASCIIYDAEKLKYLLSPQVDSRDSIDQVLSSVLTIEEIPERINKHYFSVELYGVVPESDLLNDSEVVPYLQQNLPVPFSRDFVWGSMIKQKLVQMEVELAEYNVELRTDRTVIDICKPYKNKILADRIRKINDSISDINFVPFYSGEKVTAMLWYAETNFLGTVLDKDIKGIRIRQGNILIGDENTLRKCYKEERFNSWMVGELLVFNEDIIPNTRRDDYEKNSAYKELLSQFTEWANEMSRQIRHRSYERSLTQSDKKFLADESVTDVDGVDISLGTELDSYDMDDSDSVANTDLLSKLSLLMDMGKKKTKYNVLNLNSKFTVDQKQTLEHVFDALYAKYTNAKANDIIQTIIDSF